MRYIRLGAFLFALSMTRSLGAATDLSPKFDALKAEVAALPLDQAQKVPLLTLLDAAEDHSQDGASSPLAVIELMEAFAVQCVTLIFPAQPAGGSSPQQELDLLPLIQQSDEIAADLFFDAGPLPSRLPGFPEPLPGSCSVRILARLVGTILNDPGGTLLIRFADLVQLEAEPSDPGGQFQWSVSPPIDEVFWYSKDSRLSIRMTDFTTFAVSVSYQKGNAVCSDLVLFQVQGDSPD